MVPSLEALMAATRDRHEITGSGGQPDEVTALAKQQAALRRVATLVARGAEPSEVYPVAVSELARGLGVEHVTSWATTTDGVGVVLATRDSPDRATMAVGERFPLDGDSLSAQIVGTGAAGAGSTTTTQPRVRSPTGCALWRCARAWARRSSSTAGYGPG